MSGVWPGPIGITQTTSGYVDATIPTHLSPVPPHSGQDFCKKSYWNLPGPPHPIGFQAPGSFMQLPFMQLHLQQHLILADLL